MGTATPAELAGFSLLLETVLNSPQCIPKLLEDQPAILECVNNSAETALHWLAVENCVDEIRLLHSLGAAIPDFALVHALQNGHVEVVELLLSLGGGFGSVNPFTAMDNPIWKLSDETKDRLGLCLKKYGYR